MIRRREFITLIGGAAAWPITVRAQQPALPVIGFLSARTPHDSADHVAAFRQGLSPMGYVEGRNVAIEYRWAEGRIERLRDLATDLVRRDVRVIAAVGGNNSGLAAKAATTTVPIVFTSGADPVKVGPVTSLNQPGGNVTGISWFAGELGPKRLGLLHELVPNITAVALIVNPDSPELTGQPEAARQAAQALGLELYVIAARASDIDGASAAAVRQRANAIMMGADPFYISRREQIAALAAHHTLPTIYVNREFVTAGGLISYGNSVADAYRRAGLHVGLLLRGATPNELPIDQSTKFELVINLKTANSLGLTVSPSLVARADEVIE